MPHFQINQRFFPPTKCAAYSETVCDMVRLSVRLAPFYCAACSVFCTLSFPYGIARKGGTKLVLTSL